MDLPAPDERSPQGLVGREGLDGRQRSRTAETPLEQIEQRQEPVVRLRSRRALNEQVRVAVRTRLSAQHRTEERQPRHAPFADLGRTPARAVGRPLRAEHGCHRVRRLPGMVLESRPAQAPEQLHAISGVWAA